MDSSISVVPTPRRAVGRVRRSCFVALIAACVTAAPSATRSRPAEPPPVPQREAPVAQSGQPGIREISIWSRHRPEIIAVAILILLQSALIVGLLYEHRRRREAEAMARSKLAELAHMNRLATAGELSASIAHEINQPLAGIVAYAEAGQNWLARPTPDIAQARERFEQIARAGQRAAEIVTRIRAFFKKGAPSLERVDINGIVRDVLLLVRSDLRRRKIAVELALVEPLPSVQGDRVQLQQVILNLVVNAADAMDAVTGRERILRVTSRRDDERGVRIDVQDSGPGVAVEDVERVFAPFYTTKAKGMGMGLSISRSLIEAHGGRLTGHRAEPFGMIFSFVLPMRHPGGVVAHPPEHAAEHLTGTTGAAARGAASVDVAGGPAARRPRPQAPSRGARAPGSRGS
jgi:signal transduction histidine kinase